MVVTLKWFYKPLEGMVTNLGVISSDAPHLVRFADQEGSVFDRITFDKEVVLEDELRRNGFTEVHDGDAYVQLFGLPTKIIDKRGEPKPVYSSGEHWLSLLKKV